MILRRLYDDELAQASYLLGCEAMRQAIVVDPNLNIQQYLDAAAYEGLTIACVTETHIHADFVSGARALAAATGAKLLLSGEGGEDWQYRVGQEDSRTVGPSDRQTAGQSDGQNDEPLDVDFLHAGDSIAIGGIRMDVLHTPGHTPEHLSFLVTDTAVSDQPVGMFSGDFIFVGDVGRPDLLERAAHVADSMEASAHRLFDSLRTVADLPDHLQLWPGHGAGSACGKALGAMPQSTLGYEWLTNAALRETDRAAFVRDILSAQPEPPRYFARMKQVNRDGVPAAPTPSPVGAPARHLSPAEVDDALAGGLLVVDTRSSAAFVAGFTPGTVCVPKSKSFTSYFGAVAPAEAPVVLLVADAADVGPLARRLHLIGFDRVAGWAVAEDVLDARRHAGRAVASLVSAGVDEVRRRLDAGGPRPRLVDVRGAGERQRGVIPGAIGVALGDLADWAATASRDEPVIVQCHTGTRAVIGASVLVGRGFSHVTPMTGGYDAWTAAGLPVRLPSPP